MQIGPASGRTRADLTPISRRAVAHQTPGGERAANSRRGRATWHSGARIGRPISWLAGQRSASVFASLSFCLRRRPPLLFIVVVKLAAGS